jgi:23S rRNA (adenine2503-C2)-methyltransferase
MDILKLERFLKEAGQPGFRLGQIKKAVFLGGVSSFAEVFSLPADLRKKLDENFRILPFEMDKVLVSKNKDSAKASLKLQDGNLIETVLIQPKPGFWSVCISSQVGCALGCRFCATGKMGFKRNLTAEEIYSQVLFWKIWLKGNFKFNPPAGGKNYDISNIVYMGMGEPFLNWENVAESLKVLTDKDAFGFGSRSVSISTAGIPDGIEKLAEEFSQVNLALSLHFADNEKRSEYMPINRKHNLEVLRDMLCNYLEKTNRKVFLEYILLKDINDSKEDAQKLTKWIKSINKPHLLHVNLIRYNQAAEGLTSSSKERVIQFRNYLLKNKINITIRKSLGDEIQGACGQLAGK